MSWDETDLLRAWDEVKVQVPAPFELAGVTFHGGDDPPRWVAFTYSEATSSFGEEGVGATPIEALWELAGRFGSPQ